MSINKAEQEERAKETDEFLKEFGILETVDKFLTSERVSKTFADAWERFEQKLDNFAKIAPKEFKDAAKKLAKEARDEEAFKAGMKNTFKVDLAASLYGLSRFINMDNIISDIIQNFADDETEKCIEHMKTVSDEVIREKIESCFELAFENVMKDKIFVDLQELFGEENVTTRENDPFGESEEELKLNTTVIVVESA